MYYAMVLLDELSYTKVERMTGISRSMLTRTRGKKNRDGTYRTKVWKVDGSKKG